MSLANGACLGALIERTFSKLSNGLQQEKPRLSRWAIYLPNKIFVDQNGNLIVQGRRIGVAGHGGHGIQGAPAGKNAEAPKNALMLGGEEGVTPRNRGFDSALARGGIRRPLTQYLQMRSNERAKRGWRQYSHPGGGELDCQR
ncbi:MAG TPA: hypothetical protein VHR64_02370 [Thermomicrobiales bacterium]|nr:hypothetical protein [Thermomicrobiales bacterium]